MKSIRNTITNLLILFTILIISSCNVFNFNGDLKAQTDSVLTVPCSFYETDDIDSRYEDHNFIIGKTVYSTSFPYFTQDDYLLKGWRFYKYRNPTKTGVPETLTYNQKGLIVSMYVEPDPVCLYGVWVKKRYVTFVTNCDTEFNQLVVGDGDSIQETVIFTDQYMNMKKEKHAFRGWYTDPEFNNPYDFNTPVTSDITLYAKWVLQITINYYQNDGTIRVYSDTYDYGQERWISYHRYERPQGKGFVGWATSADATSPSYYLDDVLRDQAEDLDLYAVWSTDTVTITYHQNNGDDTTHIETVGRGAKFRIGHYTKIEQNMTRACWLASLNDLWPTPGKSIRACSANASSSIDAAEYPIINSLETISDSIDLYCIWGDKTYNVHFFIQDPVSKKRKNINNESVSWGSKATAPDENPYLPGYVFVGWCLNVNGQMSDTIFDFNTVLNEENLGTDGDYVEFVSKFEPGSQNQNVFYVSSMTELQKNGTGLYPFATVSEAISAINSINNSSQSFFGISAKFFINSL